MTSRPPRTDDQEADLAFWIMFVILVCCFVVGGLWLEANKARAQQYDVLVLPVASLSNTALAIKASPGPLMWLQCYNPNATVAWVQFYDTAGAVTVGTTVPTRFFAFGPLQSSGFVYPDPIKGTLAAAAGIKVAATTTATGGTAPTAALSCEFAIR
jgi:hypothetical protein